MRKIIKPCGFHCIKVNHLGVRFNEQVVLEDVNLHIHCGSLNAVIGKNGAGKSTLIRAMLDNVPHTGEIEFRDTKDGKMQKLKRKIRRSVCTICWQVTSHVILYFYRRVRKCMRRSKRACVFLRRRI